MIQLPPIIQMHNGSYHGTRLSPYNSRITHPHKGYHHLTFEIDYHHVRKEYMVTEHYALPEIRTRRDGKTWFRWCTYGHWTYFGVTVQDCIKYIWETYGVIINLVNSPVNIAHEDPKMEAKLERENI